MSNPTPTLILPVVKGKSAIISYKLITPDRGEGDKFRVMVGDRWLDKGYHLRTLEECIALVHEAAAKALGLPMDAPPDWKRGQAVRVSIPGPMSVRQPGGRSEVVRSCSARRVTRTRLACDPYTRDGIHYVRVVGYDGELPCTEVEVVE